MKKILKISIPVVALIGLTSIVVSYLDLGSLEGHGKVQKAKFETVEKQVSSLEKLENYMLFRPFSTDGINASSDIQGFLWSEKNNVFHGHLSALGKPLASNSICIDWTVNGLGVICERDGLRVHPCNSGSRVLEKFSFYEYDIQKLLAFEDNIISDLSKLKHQSEVVLGDVSCKILEKFKPIELPASAICPIDKFAVCESSQ